MAVDRKELWTSVTTGDSLVGRRAGSVRTRVARLLGVHKVAGTASRVLGRLPEGWFPFNDVPIGDRGASIDHVIVGPAGVFTVDTKHLTGEVRVCPRSLLHNGRRTSYLAKALSQAERASRSLSVVLGREVTVFPVLAILVDEWTIKQKPVDVLVDAPRGVRDWLLRQPVVLRPAEVLAIAAAVSKRATWAQPAR